MGNRQTEKERAQFAQLASIGDVDYDTLKATIAGSRNVPQQAAQGGEREAFEHWFFTLDPADHPDESDAWYVWQAARAAQGGREALTEEHVKLIGARALDKCFGTDAQHLYIVRETERAHGITTPAGDSE